MSNPKSIGERSEAHILAAILEKGIAAAIPFGNNQRYDLVLDDGGHLLRAQCKTGKLRDGCVVFKTCSVNGFTGERKSYCGQADIFLVYCPQNTKMYRVPVPSTPATEMRLRVTPLKKGAPAGGVHFAVDHEF